MFVCATDIKYRFFVQNVFRQEAYQRAFSNYGESWQNYTEIDLQNEQRTKRVCEKSDLNSQRFKLRIRDIGPFSLP